MCKHAKPYCSRRRWALAVSLPMVQQQWLHPSQRAQWCHWGLCTPWVQVGNVLTADCSFHSQTEWHTSSLGPEKGAPWTQLIFCRRWDKCQDQAAPLPGDGSCGDFVEVYKWMWSQDCQTSMGESLYPSPDKQRKIRKFIRSHQVWMCNVTCYKWILQFVQLIKQQD